jgi:signal transduction histidine kinase
MRSLIRQDPQQAEAFANELGEDLRRATAEIRRLVYDLRPPMLDELGLVGAIKNFRFPNSDVHFEVDGPEPLPPLSAAVEVAAYRIAGEACHNVVKHAQATACRLGIEVSDGYLMVSVTDNGRGMPSDPTAGVGVRSMRERAVELGGTLSIQSGENGGTRVVARLPKGD